MSQTPNKGANVDPLLKNIANALYFTNTDDVAIRTGIEGDIIVNNATLNLPSATIDIGAIDKDATIIPWQVQVARGKILGIAGLSISGYNPSVGNSFVPLWDGSGAASYTYFTTAQPVRVWSSSSSDTDVTVLVSGLDSNYAPITETIHLTNGATGVVGSLNFLRVNSASLTKTPMNIGVISVGNSGKTITLTTIDAGAGRSQMTIYTVPAGYTFYLTQSNFFTNNTGQNTGLYRSWTQSALGVINIVLTVPFPEQYNSLKVVPRPYAEKTDIQWQVSCTNSSKVGGQIEGYLIQNGI